MANSPIHESYGISMRPSGELVVTGPRGRSGSREREKDQGDSNGAKATPLMRRIQLSLHKLTLHHILKIDPTFLDIVSDFVP